MAEPNTYVQATCAECGTLIIKPQKTTTSTVTAPLYRSTMETLRRPTMEMFKAARPAPGDRIAVCSQCRKKTKLPAKDITK